MGLLPPPLGRFFPALCRNHFTSLQFTYDRRVCRPPAPLVRSPFGRSVDPPCRPPCSVHSRLPPSLPLPCLRHHRQSPFRPSLATGRAGEEQGERTDNCLRPAAATPPNCMTRASSTKGALGPPVRCIADLETVVVLCSIRPLAVMSLQVRKTLSCSFYDLLFSNSTVSYVDGS